MTRIACPSVAFLAEAIVAPTKLLAYLGAGPYTGKVSDLAYHNSLMVQIWSMLAARDVRLAAQALGALPPKPPTATWLTYLRCHDDIGWAIMDEDAAAVGATGHGHRSFLAHWYAGDFAGSPARGLVFQYNPDTDDRRTSGSAASLIGLEAAQSVAEVDRAASALRLAHALVLGWGGIPVIWSGDELGQPNDPRWASEPGHEEDNRWAHRPRLDWARAEQRHDRGTVAGRVFGDLVALVACPGAAGAPARVGRDHGGAGRRPGRAGDGARAPGGPVRRRATTSPREARPWLGWRVGELGVADARDEITGEACPGATTATSGCRPTRVLWLTTDRP